MPTIPSHGVLVEALIPQPFTGSRAPLPPDLKVEETRFYKQTFQQVVKMHSRQPLLVATLVLVSALVLTGVTHQGVFGGLATVAFSVFALTWAIRRHLRIAKQAREETQVKWPSKAQSLQAVHEAAVRDHQMNEAKQASDWDQLETTRVQNLQQLMAGHIETVDDAVQAVLEELDFPFDANCSARAISGDAIVVAVDLPEVEDVIPEVRMKALKNGTVKEVRRSKAERLQGWRHLVLGIAFQIGRTICAIAPSIQSVTVAGYTQRRQRSRALADDWVFELCLARSLLANLDPTQIDPMSAADLPNSRVILMADGNLKKIPPPEWLAELSLEAIP